MKIRNKIITSIALTAFSFNSYAFVCTDPGNLAENIMLRIQEVTQFMQEFEQRMGQIKQTAALSSAENDNAKNIATATLQRQEQMAEQESNKELFRDSLANQFACGQGAGEAVGGAVACGVQDKIAQDSEEISTAADDVENALRDLLKTKGSYKNISPAEEAEVIKQSKNKYVKDILTQCFAVARASSSDAVKDFGLEQCSKAADALIVLDDKLVNDDIKHEAGKQIIKVIAKPNPVSFTAKELTLEGILDSKGNISSTLNKIRKQTLQNIAIQSLTEALRLKTKQSVNDEALSLLEITQRNDVEDKKTQEYIRIVNNLEDVNDSNYNKFMEANMFLNGQKLSSILMASNKSNEILFDIFKQQSRMEVLLASQLSLQIEPLK